MEGVTGMPLDVMETREDLSGVLGELGVGEGPIWIKINLTSPAEGMYTHPEVLKEFFAVLSRPVVLLESYAVGRGRGPVADLPQDEGAYLQALRNEERDYLRAAGLDEILDMTGVGLLNLTEVCAAGEAATRADVQPIVEEAAGPVRFEEFYDAVPRSLFAQRHKGILLNLARMKVPATDRGDWSLALKNMFGLVPLPDRMPYHDAGLVDALLDINSVYRSLFHVVDIIEGLRSVVVYSGDGQHDVPWGRYDLVQDRRLLAWGNDPVSLELETARHFGRDLSERSLIRRAKARFGT